MSDPGTPIKFPLSLPVSKIPNDTFDLVVVGSGYGGAVVAYRAAKAGLNVALLERGAEIDPGAYPNTLLGIQAQLRVETDDGAVGPSGGMFDLRVGPEVSVLVGRGLGGTSLINANVALRARKSVLTGSKWPLQFRQDPDFLDPYYAKAEKCLGSNPYPVEYPELNKVAALKKAAKAVGKPFQLPPINVTFAAGPNHFKFQQSPCVLCGDCTTGCNYSAKNTTLMNYLAAAAQSPNPKVKAKAKIFNGAEVEWIEQVSEGWQVSVKNLTAPVLAKRVALAAGTLGSTEILLRSQARRKLAISNTIGKRFSTNGDALAWGYDTDWGAETIVAELAQGADARRPIYGVGSANRLPSGTSTFSTDPALRPGPCIAGMIDCQSDVDVKKGLIIEEGVIPSAFATVTPALAFLGSAMADNFFQYADGAARLQDAQSLGTTIQNDPASLADEAYRGPVGRTQSYLVMSHDDSHGHIEYDTTTDKIRVRWPGAGSKHAFRHDDRVLEEVNEAIRGSFLPDPLWSEALGRQLITVHPLGGCPMADSGAEGVVNYLGQVFVDSTTSKQTYPNLFVCDGSIIPTSLGVNPLLTITALAEWIATNVVKALGPKSNDDSARCETRAAIAVAVPPAAVEGATLDAPPPQKPPPGAIAFFLGTQLLTNANNPTNTPPIVAEANVAADAALAALVKAAGPLQSGTESQLRTQLVQQEQDRIGAEAVATILDPLDECFVAWLANQDDKPLEAALTTELETLLEKLMQRFPSGFTPQFTKQSQPKPNVPQFMFSERMHGFICDQAMLPHVANDGTNIADPFQVASDCGKALGANQHLVAAFQISTNDLNALANDPSHSAIVTGTLTCPALYSSAINVAGTLALLITDPERVETSQMIYQVSGTIDGSNGTTQINLLGVKYLHSRPGSSPWTDLTTLYSTVTITEIGKSSNVLMGILRLELKDAIALAQTIPPASALTQFPGGIVDSIAALPYDGCAAAAVLITMGANVYFGAQFAAFFSQAVFRTYGGLLADLENFAARDNKLRPRRALKAPTPAIPEVHPLRTADGFEVQLTRYNPVQSTPTKPVILAPGFLTSAASFAADTVATNVVEFLNTAGCDVWLFDYRGSPALPAGRAFTVDDIATYDWPLAIDYVCEVTTPSTHLNPPQVRVLAHCVGALSFLMALLREQSQQPGVMPPLSRKILAAVCSQLSLHPVTNWLNYLKVDLDVLGTLEKTLHVSSVDLVSSKTMTSEMLDAWLWRVPVPPGEECVNPLCHRVFSVFGPSWAHAQLNADTHNALLKWFGTVPAKALDQLTTIMKKGKAVDHKGQDVYLPNVANLNQVPITFIAGELNQIFTPESSLITLQWLREKNPGSAASYQRKVFPGYAHMDHFIGKTASTDVFPSLLDMLNLQSKQDTTTRSGR